MFSHVSVHPSIHPSICLSTPGGGGTLARSRLGGGVPQPGPAGGYPTLGTPIRPGQGGTPPQVPPGQTWLGVPHLEYPPSDLAGGTLIGVPHLRYHPPCWTLPGRYPDWGGTPPWVPPIRPGQGGTPPQVPPGQTWLGGTSPQVPPIRPGRGGIPIEGTPPRVPPPPLLDLAEEVPWLGGYPTSGTTPIRPGWGVLWRGGVYFTSYMITDGVLDTPRSVCLLRSRRRTFLWRLFWQWFNFFHQGPELRRV